MCGIAGYVSYQSNVNHAEALRSMAAVIAHRGPDDEGFFETATHDGKVKIGWRIVAYLLSIFPRSSAVG